MNEILTIANQNIANLIDYFNKNGLTPIFKHYQLLFLDFLYIETNN